MNIESGKLTKLTNLTGSSEGIWSPDGSQMLFLNGDDDAADICIINSDGSDVRNLTSKKARAREANPSWSPDGKSILFVSAMDGNLEIYAMPLK